MKKIIIAAAFAACALGMNAQLTVLKSGNVRIGYKSLVPQPWKPANATSATIPGNTDLLACPDSLSTLCLIGKDTNGSGSYITFGYGKNVGIGEIESALKGADSNILSLFGSRGISYRAGDKNVFSYSIPSLSGSAPFVFNCDVRANSFLATSDARMKKDINELSGLGSVLSDITPVSYHLADGELMQKASAEVAGDENSTTPMPPSDRLLYGFVAQEVRDVFPNLVVEDENGYLSIDYLGFIPILVDAYKNLEGVVKEQQELIASMSSKNGQRKAPSTSVGNLPGDNQATLLQNRPNPFKESTTIACTVPEGSAEAFVCVYDLQGSQVKRFDIAERGNCSVTVDGSSLKPGMYIYALIIDGAEIESKKMILTD